MKARKRLIGYDDNAAPVAWALLVYLLVVSVLVGAGFAAVSPNQVSYGAYFAAFEDAVRGLVSLLGLG
jgi:ABC-type transporter Mla maintaining outer membrane lipid asymmetry permease subunit MlaE